MLSIYNLIILSGVAAAALVSIGRPRYLFWLAAIALSYMVCVTYAHLGGESPEIVSALLDLCLAGCIAWFALRMWELWIGVMYVISGFVGMVYLSHNLMGADVIPADVHASILELINMLAIITIGGVAAFDKAGMVDGLAFHPWLHLFGRVRHAHQRSDPRA
jgi:hypothetical protein